MVALPLPALRSRTIAGLGIAVLSGRTSGSLTGVRVVDFDDVGADDGGEAGVDEGVSDGDDEASDVGVVVGAVLAGVEPAVEGAGASEHPASTTRATGTTSTAAMRRISVPFVSRSLQFHG